MATIDPAASPVDGDRLYEVTLTLCHRCLDGEGGECHTPGCALWLNRAPDLPLWWVGQHGSFLGKIVDLYEKYRQDPPPAREVGEVVVPG